METNKPILSASVACYEPLLKRYARRLIHDEALSEKLVKQVLEDQYNIDKLNPSPRLRQILKTDLLNRCQFWKLSQIFDPPVIKAPLEENVKLNEHINQSKN